MFQFPLTHRMTHVNHIKGIVNLFSYEKRGAYLSVNLLTTLSDVRKLLLCKYTFLALQYHFCFCFTLEVEGVLFLLMASCLNKEFETK